MKLDYRLVLFYICALIVNFVLLISVIDVHFPVLNSPFIRNQCFLHTNSKHSKRLAIFLSDGLRADSFFNVTAELSKSFLRSKMQTGTWGISTAAAPTLTREGISSILTGKPSPSSELVRQVSNFFSGHDVEMADNVFNSNYTHKVFFSGVDSVIQYFGNQSIVDKWVTHEWSNFLYNLCHYNFQCYDTFSLTSLKIFLEHPAANLDKIVFFIYLYGQDFCSHKLSPRNKICQNEIKFIDKNIGEAYKKIEDYYNDNLTTYLFTSDHGMTDWGVHGWVSNEEAQTPYVLWGHGVTKAGTLNNSPKSWKVDNLTRFDMNQIDLAPILAVLRGVPIPKESIGVLHPEILSFDEEQKGKAMYCNLKGLQYLIEGYSKNLKLDQKTLWDIKNKTEIINEIFKSKNFSQLILKCKELIQEYIHIYKHLTQDYYKGHLITVISSIYIGWGLLLFSNFFLSVLRHEIIDHRISCITTFFIIAGTPIIFLIFKWPLRFLIYYYLSIACWIFSLKNITLITTDILRMRFVPTGLLEMIFSFLFSFIVILCVLKPFIAQVSLVILTLNFYRLIESKVPGILHVSWLGSAMLLLFFVHYPIIQQSSNLFYVQVSTVCWIFFIVLYICYGNCSKKDSIWSFASLFCTTIAIMNLTFIVNEKEKKHYMISWILLLSIFFPIMSAQKNIRRLFHVIFALGISFILMSVHHEALGLLSYAIHVLSWVCLEIRCKNNDASRAFYFLFYVWIGFFAIGNYDLPTSYNMEWTRCFFAMVGYNLIPLIMYKQFIPILIVTACIITIYNKLQRSTFSVLTWYLFLNNGIAFYFFLKVKNNGLGETHEGHSHMHHILSQVLPMAVIGLYPIVAAIVNINFKQPAFFEKMTTRMQQVSNLS